MRRKWSELGALFMQGIEENLFYSLSKSSALNLSRLFQIAFFSVLCGSESYCTGINNCPVISVNSQSYCRCLSVAVKLKF